MTDKEKLNLLLEAGESMRKLQCAFFKEKVKSSRDELLKKSKEKEKVFDSLLFSFRQTSFEFGEMPKGKTDVLQNL